MKFWLVKTGEPLPSAHRNLERMHRTGQLGEILASRGHSVTWWTSTFDHYGRRQLYAEDTDYCWHDNITIRMLHGCGYQRNVSFSRMREHRVIAAKFAVRARQDTPPDIIYCAYPTIEFSVEAVRYGAEVGIPVVLDIRDLHPDIFADVFPRWARPLAKIWLVRAKWRSELACSGATAISGVTEEFRNWGLQRAGRSCTEWDRWFPFGYQSRMPQVADREKAEKFWDNLGVRSDDSFRVCFIGTIGRTLDLDQVISAAFHVAENTRIHFVLCGAGERLFHYQRLAKNLTNVVFPGRINAAQIYVLMRRCSVGLDPLPDRFDFLASINNKAIEYMSGRLPVVSCPDRGVLAEMLSAQGCGISWKAGSGVDLARVLTSLSQAPEVVEHMSAQATRVFDERYKAEIVYGEMASHLERLAHFGPFQ